MREGEMGTSYCGSLTAALESARHHDPEMVAARLFATSLTRSLQALLDSPEGPWGPCEGSRLKHGIAEVDARLPWMRSERDLYVSIGHPEGPALASEIAALESLRASIHT